MAHIVLVTGGGRSGKSEYARRMAEAMDGPRGFVATCPSIDEEMEERIRRHRRVRDESKWDTLEEPHQLARVVRDAKAFNVLVVDCLTLWINNLMYKAEPEGRSFTEDDVTQRCRELLDACDEFEGAIIFVTNEVGMGIVPENRASRLYRDLVGRCNRIMAERADQVTMVVSGIPLNLKNGDQ